MVTPDSAAGPINPIGSISFEGNKFALVVGINTPSISSYLPPLKYAENDAFDVFQTLRQPECGFDFLSPALLGSRAQTNDVRSGVIKLAKKKADQNFLLFYFIGHAQPMKTREGYNDIYFVTYDFSEDEIKEDPDAHLSMRWLRKLLYQPDRAGSVLIILDCCYAGHMINVGSDPFRIDLDLRKLVEECFDDPITNHQNGRLRVILTATGDNTPAHEKDGHALMTGLLLPVLQGKVQEALNHDGDVDLLHLYEYLQRRMPQEQFPNLAGEFAQTCILARYPALSERLRREAQKAEENELKNQVSRLSDQMSEVSRIITDPNFFDRQAAIYQTQPFDCTICKAASLENLDMQKIAEFFRKDKVRQQEDFRPGLSHQAQLGQMNLLQKKHPTYGTLLCFGRNPSKWLTGACIRCIYWRGNDRHSGWLEDQEYRGNLLEQFELSCRFLRKCLRLSRIIDSEGSNEQWEIPFRVLEEALVNALVHREYANPPNFIQQTNFVRVEVFDDRIEISSPGEPPPPMTLELLGIENECHPRNPQIMRIFYLNGYVERVGSGIQRMQQLIKKAELPPLKLELSKTKTFKVILHRPKQVPAVRYVPLVKPLQRISSRKLLTWIGLSILVLGLLTGILYRLLLSGAATPPPHETGIGVVIAPDGEPIGISDGTFAFDTRRLDGDLKRQAAAKLKAGDTTGAESLWQQGIVRDTNDAEALIYLEDQIVLASQRHYITLIVGTTLTGSFIVAGRDNLQGAYVAQKEYDDTCLSSPNCIPVRLLIANAGSGDSATNGVAYASYIMQQVIHARQDDTTIVGMMGWPVSSNSFYASTVLGTTLPQVSPTALATPSTQVPPYLFSVAPSNTRQGSIGAQYAKRTLHARRVALFVDPVDPYSEKLATAFSQQFQADGNSIVAIENYTVGQPQTAVNLLPDALNHHPDLIYFAGHSQDVGVLLTALPPCGPSNCLQVLGGDAFYELGGYPADAQSQLYRLHFTAFANPDEWGILAPSAQTPPFFSDYLQAFDPQRLHQGSPYGYTRADNTVILSYDAMRALLTAISLALNAQPQNLTPRALEHALAQITGSRALQGASGNIAFGSDGNPIDKEVVILYFDQSDRIHLDQAYGCFLKSAPTASCS